MNDDERFEALLECAEETAATLAKFTADDDYAAYIGKIDGTLNIPIAARGYLRDLLADRKRLDWLLANHQTLVREGLSRSDIDEGMGG